MLVLPINKKWFELIISGEKKEEYRSLTPYYRSRLKKLPPETDIILRNGYSRFSPFCVVNVTVCIGFGLAKWGAEPDTPYYVLCINCVKQFKAPLCKGVGGYYYNPPL